MAISIKKLTSKDKVNVLDLIQTRIDAKSRVCLTDNRINQAWVDEVMIHDETYDRTHRVFGLYIDRLLHTMFILKIVGDLYVVSMMISTKEKGRELPIENGYNQHTTMLLEAAILYMETEGYTEFYSIIPDHPKWKRAENNPKALLKNRYKIEEVEHIPAGQMTKNPFHLNITTRPFNLNMVIRKMTKIP